MLAGGECTIVDVDREPAVAFGELARTLSTADPSDIARRVTTAAPRLVPGCREAVFCLVDRHGGVVPVAATSEAASSADRAGHEAGDGPCLAAIRADAVVRPVDACGVAALPVRAGGEVLGALTVTARVPDDLGPRAVSLAGVLSVHAGIALAAATARERNVELTEALRTSRLIGTALGIVMANRRLTPEQAFELLRRCSRRRHRKVRELAAEIVATGEVPESDGPGGR